MPTALRQIKLFSNLDDIEWRDFARGLKPVNCAAGETLLHQGAPPGGAYILESGKVEVVTRLPGGGEMFHTELGPGEVFGEVGLIDAVQRTASVKALTPLSAHYLERRHFQGALAQLDTAAFKVMRQLLGLLYARLRTLTAKLIELAEPGPAPSYDPSAPAPLADASRASDCSFDYRLFLSILPFFNAFSAPDLGFIDSHAHTLELPRGTPVFTESWPARACFIVLRGALVLYAERGGRRQQLAVFGPGCIVGANALVLELAHDTSCEVRSDALVLELTRDVFAMIFRGVSELSLAFLNALAAQLAQTLTRANHDLIRETGYRRLGRRSA